MIDVAPYQLEIIEKILQKFVSKCEVRAFGSRAAWTAKDYSDLDLAIVGTEKLPDGVIFSIREVFQESDLPFRVDVLDWNAISKEFREVIEKKYEVIQKITDTAKTGEVPEGWEERIFSEVVDVNPKRELKKGSTARFVSMADLKEFNRKIQSFTTRTFPGGSKFINGDTLMARITPCLENGKTVFVDILENGEVGCGSTEFMVLCGRDGKSINEFVYYLAVSPDIRKKAIKSMTGTSGRQRVESDVFDKLTIKLPAIVEQRAIVKILSDLDEKIELNHKMNKTLEATAQALFKQWFEEFEFPGYNKTKFIDGLPEGWHEGKLIEACDIMMGQSPPGETYNESGNGVVFHQGNRDFGFHFPTPRVYCTAPTRIAEAGDVLISVRAPVGALNITIGRCAIGRGVAALRMKHYSNGFLFYFLSTRQDLWDQFNSEGTVFGCLNKTEFHKVNLVIPSAVVLRQFDAIVKPIEEMILRNELEIRALGGIRDSLLPKLMLGKIRVKKWEA